ncbi:RNA-binding domain-containing protein [Gryllotalpicola reticulitermitis]|uniref:RNA-binding domain-containing protein n=1 Tax=Gryllotalpicola reticulitermitis TaxID=1184153 RepID=A0ABV8Q6B3_9MICO
MALNIDPAKALRTPRQREELVRAVLAANPKEESRHVEWKTDLGELTTTHASFVAARAILGMANRSLSVARTAFEGGGYLVLGAEPENLTGQVMPDPANLVPAIERYVGRTVEWDPHRVTVDGTDVVVISVEPPRAGDRIRTLQRAYQGSDGKQVEDGTVFVRYPGRTDRARKEDIEALQDRLVLGTAAPEIELDVSWASGEPRAFCVDTGPEAIEQWTASTGHELKASVPTVSAYNFGNTGVTRGAVDKYKAKIAEYLEDTPQHLPAIVRRWLVQGALEGASWAWVLSARNPTEASIAGISIRIKLPVGLEAYSLPPQAPTIKRPEFEPDSLISSMMLAGVPYQLPHDNSVDVLASLNSDVSVEQRTDGWEILYERGRLHAGRLTEFEPVVFVTAEPEGTEFELEIDVAASSATGHKQERVTVTAVGGAISPLLVVPARQRTVGEGRVDQ